MTIDGWQQESIIITINGEQQELTLNATEHAG